MKIFIPGASGRMGRLLIAEIANNTDCELVGATVRAGSIFENQHVKEMTGIKELNVILTSDPHQGIAACDVVIDFSVAELVTQHAMLAAQAGASYLCAVTGLNDEIFKTFEGAARHVSVLYSANTSFGILLLSNLVAQTSSQLDLGWDIEIVEMHHNQKRDAPSGTALKLGQAASEGRKQTQQSTYLPPHHGDTGPRRSGGIGYAAVRAGDIVGEHSVIFANAGERIELTHRATNRSIFAKGALLAARWLVQQKKGIYSMEDIIR